MYVQAAPGLRIIDPDLKDALPAEGREVPDTFYWHRLLATGDVVSATPPEPALAGFSLPAEEPVQ